MEEPADATFVDVHGQITLEPEPFGTTRMTMTASVQLAARSEGIKTLTGQEIKPRTTGSQGIKAVANRLVNIATATSLSTVPPLAHATLDHLLSCVPNLHAMYARYNQIDDATYAAFERDIPAAPPVLAHENALCDKSRAYDDQVRNGDTRRARVRTQGHTEHKHTHAHTHTLHLSSHRVCSPSHGGASPTRSANPSRTSNELKAKSSRGARRSLLLTHLLLVLSQADGALQATNTSRAMSRNRARALFARLSTMAIRIPCSSWSFSVSAEFSRIESSRRPSRGARKTTDPFSSLGLPSKR